MEDSCEKVIDGASSKAEPGEYNNSTISLPM